MDRSRHRQVLPFGNRYAKGSDLVKSISYGSTNVLHHRFRTEHRDSTLDLAIVLGKRY